MFAEPIADATAKAKSVADAAVKAEAERLEWNGTISSKIPAVKSVKVKAGKKKVKVSRKKTNTKNLKKSIKLKYRFVLTGNSIKQIRSVKKSRKAKKCYCKELIEP